MRALLRRWLRSACITTLVLGTMGCAGPEPAYYWQSITGHLDMLRQARPIESMLASPALDPRLRAKLERVRDIRAFASRELGLPDNGSYTRYADLKRPYVVWNIFAAPELSMQLKQWCFPVVGCVTYRGYYSREDAEKLAAELREAGFDVQVAGIPAYSTLGWFDDPVLNTFINYPDGELARLIFHELAHQVLYVKGDSTFNESFATAVEEAGLERWLAHVKDPALEAAYRQFAQRRAQFIALLKQHRSTLETLYRSSASDEAKRAGKKEVLAALVRDYQQLKERWGGWAGYDRWFSQQLGNAHLAAVATYNDLVPGFRKLLSQQGGDLVRFYAAARALSSEPKAGRDEVLRSASSD